MLDVRIATLGPLSERLTSTTERYREPLVVWSAISSLSGGFRARGACFGSRGRSAQATWGYRPATPVESPASTLLLQKWDTAKAVAPD